MAKHRVRVRLVAECEVEIEVEADEGYDPTDLTLREQQEAESSGDTFPRWEVDDVELIEEVKQ